MDLIGQEIFDVGTWNKMPFTDADLNGIVDSFDKIENQKVFLKLGHNDEQDITDGQPAIGWVERIYRKGTKLVADFRDLPQVIHNAISKRLYRTVSVELLRNVEYKDNTIPWLLDAVALLGSDQPAVNTLADLEALTLSANTWNIPENSRFRVVFQTVAGTFPSEDLDMGEVSKAELDRLQARLDASEKERDDFKTQTGILEEQNVTFKADNTKFKADNDARDKADAEARVKLARDSATEVLEKAVKAGGITPAQREGYVKLFRIDDDEAVISIDLKAMSKTLGAEKSDMDKSKTFDKDKTLEGEDATDALDRMTVEFQAEHNEDDYAKAFTRVSAANPRLHREYLMRNGS